MFFLLPVGGVFLPGPRESRTRGGGEDVKNEIALPGDMCVFPPVIHVLVVVGKLRVEKDDAHFLVSFFIFRW